MSAARERSVGPTAGQPRMLRIEYKGQPYDWFNLDEMGDIVRTSDFSNTLRENITHYFGVPFEYQAIYDEEGILSSMIDFSRALRSVRPWLRVYDAREMMPELKEKTTKQLEEIHAEVMRSQRSVSGWGFGTSELPLGGSFPPAQNGQSPPRGYRDPSLSLADAVKSASELGAHGMPSVQLTQPTNFPWGGPALEAYGMPKGAPGVSPRYPTPPLQSFQQPMASQLPGMRTPPMGSHPAWGARPAALGSGPPSSLSMAPPMSQGQRPVFNAMGQPPMPPSYGGGPSMGVQMPPHAHHAIGSSTPPMPQHGMPPQEVWRQQPHAANMMGGGSTPPQPPPGAAAAAALAATAPGEMGGYHSRPSTQRDIQVGQDQAAQAMAGMIEVVLAKEPGFERFGFANVPTRDNRALAISWVDSSGLLEMKWNRLVSPAQQVTEGAVIMSVNGKADDIEAMRDQLQVPQVHLVVQRSSGKPAV